MRFDDEIVSPTQRYLKALHELAEAELEMLRNHFTDSDCWEWVELFVGDMACMYHLQFRSGPEEEKPYYMGVNERVKVHASTKHADFDSPEEIREWLYCDVEYGGGDETTQT